jgi:hypothetical protein
VIFRKTFAIFHNSSKQIQDFMLSHPLSPKRDGGTQMRDGDGFAPHKIKTGGDFSPPVLPNHVMLFLLLLILVN